MMINKISKNEENSKKLYDEAQKLILEEEIINKFINERNIIIQNADIERTRSNIKNVLANNENNIYIKLINKYDLSSS